MAVTIKGFGSDWSVPASARVSLDALYDRVDPQGRAPVRVGDLFTNVRDHGVAGDGTTDDTAAIQALINAQPTTGAALYFPAGTYRISNLTVPAGVQLVGAGKMYGYGPSGRGVTRFLAVAGTTGWMIDMTGSNVAVVGIDVKGDQATTTGGIRADGSWSRFSEIHLEGFRGPGFKLAGGNACAVDNILAFNCVMDRAVTAATGVVEIGGNDHWVSRVEANASLSTTVSSSNLFVNAWLISSANAFYSNCVGEISDRGYLITGQKNRFTGMRADRNMAGGYEVTGGGNTFAACMAVDNAAAATDTYPAFLTSGTSNTYTGCVASYTAGKLPTYAFEDTVESSSPGARNTYSGCTGNAARAVFLGKNYTGSSFDVANHAVRVSSGTTIPVDRSGYQVLAYTAATTVTDFTGGHSGQTITVFPLNSNVTVAHGSPIRMMTKRSTVLQAETTYRFTRYNGVWYEIPGSTLMLVSPNNTRYRLTVGDDGTLGTTTA